MLADEPTLPVDRHRHVLTPSLDLSAHPVDQVSDDDLPAGDWRRNQPRFQGENFQRNLELVAKVRQIEVLLSQGKTVPLACKEGGITDQTYYRWRKEYGGLQLEQAKKLKELQKENAQLKRALATLTLEKQVLKDIAEGNF